MKYDFGSVIIKDLYFLRYILELHLPGTKSVHFRNNDISSGAFITSSYIIDVLYQKSVFWRSPRQQRRFT